MGHPPGQEHRFAELPQLDELADPRLVLAAAHDHQPGRGVLLSEVAERLEQRREVVLPAQNGDADEERAVGKREGGHVFGRTLGGTEAAQRKRGNNTQVPRAPRP